MTYAHQFVLREATPDRERGFYCAKCGQQMNKASAVCLVGATA